MDKTVTRIDDDISIVATVQPNVLPHLRQDCSEFNFVYALDCFTFLLLIHLLF